MRRVGKNFIKTEKLRHTYYEALAVAENSRLDAVLIAFNPLLAEKR
jgi:hypothetical protein